MEPPQAQLAAQADNERVARGARNRVRIAEAICDSREEAEAEAYRPILTLLDYIERETEAPPEVKEEASHWIRCCAAYVPPQKRSQAPCGLPRLRATFRPQGRSRRLRHGSARHFRTSSSRDGDPGEPEGESPHFRWRLRPFAGAQR